MTVVDATLVHDERVKLRANTFNAIGLGFIAFALIRPLVDGGAGISY